MERNFETVMIEQCAPVLASLKPAGLFRYETRDCADLARRVKNWNTPAEPQGACVCGYSRAACATTGILCMSTAKVGWLPCWQMKRCRAFCGRRATACRKRAKHRMWAICSLSFPASCAVRQNFRMRSGVFLGYPLGDVVGFIENRGKNFTCCGCWKSYGDPDAAQKHFDQLSKCTAVYLRLFHSGTPILRLAVAA